MPKVGEWLLLHRASKTLIVGDLLFNLEPPRDRREALMQRLLGLFGGPARGRRYPGFVIDPPAFRASLERVLASGFERLVLAHGAPIEAQAMGVLRSVWKLTPP
jgi:glyoxylase-like metal-dependent hydrolase (beta-lactamase superfamily II)